MSLVEIPGRAAKRDRSDKGFCIHALNYLTTKKRRQTALFPCSVCGCRLFLIRRSVLAASYSRPLGLPSPQLRFTSVFGMRTGGATAPNHQNAESDRASVRMMRTTRENKQVISNVGRRLAACRITCDFQSSRRDRRISTSRLNTLRCVHLKPINVIISHGSRTIPNLGAGFAPICFQRLSAPNIATLRCRWHDSR